MTIAPTETQLVDPDRLLIVNYSDRDGTTHEVPAITCRYVPAIDATGGRRVALEVVHDPAFPRPTAAYYCPPGRLQRLLLPPARVAGVRPYRA